MPDSPLALSVLDQSPISEGMTGADALHNTIDLARLADDLGYTRYWVAEHHNMASIATSAPEVLIAHIAAVTERIRVGAGGIMIPNHTPLRVVDNRKASDVTYHYRIVDAPVWAQDEGLKKQFPELARKTSANAEGKTTVMSAYEGWEVPDYGKPVIE